MNNSYTREYSLGFGKREIKVELSEANSINVLKPNKVTVSITGEEEVKRALLEPIASPRLKDLVKQGEKIVIVTSDITRPMPSKVVLPYILQELYHAKVSDEDIKIVFALGSHRKHTEEEKRYLVGEEIYKRIECLDSDGNDCVKLGITSAETPVNIFRTVVEADKRICLGNIEYHYFAGYSGGAKAIMPGVSNKEAIQANHSMMVQEGAKAGALEHNPIRKDIEEVEILISLDFIVNVVLDEDKKIIKAVAGHYLDAHREGCRFLDNLYKVGISEPADIVVVSPGGYPKDINLYQAQKALDNAKHAVKKGGIIILAASCKEGLGNETFERWMIAAQSPEEMISNIQKNFQLGGHKAAAIAMVLKKAQIFLVSDLEETFVKNIFLEPFCNVENALNEAISQQGPDAKIIMMPYGGSTLPAINS